MKIQDSGFKMPPAARFKIQGSKFKIVADRAGEPEKGASVAVEAVAVGWVDGALEREYVVFHYFRQD